MAIAPRCRCLIAPASCFITSATARDSANFRCPPGLFIDRNDRIYVVDSYNRRVQVFHYYGIKQAKGGLQ